MIAKPFRSAFARLLYGLSSGATALICLSAQTAAGEPAQILNRFGSWAIIKNGDFISLSSETGNIGVGCGDSSLSYITIVNISDQSAVVWHPDVKAFYFNFTAWADAGTLSDFSLLVREKGDRTASGIVVLNPDYADQNTRFWAMLKSARSNFSYSTKAGTLTVDAVDLAPAIARFQQECAKVFLANAHKRLSEPIPREWLNR